MTHSAVYVGRVVHQRHRPERHRLEYRVFSLLLDLNELPQLDRRLRLFGHNRGWLFSLRDRDHGRRDGGDLRRHVTTHLREAGIEGADARILLLCYPRVFGHVFNPLSVYYCLDRDERLRAVIYEVSNTHGEKHSYVMPVQAQRRPIRHEADKVFFVSPFLPMDCRYRFQINHPGRSLQLFIHETHQGQPILDAWFVGERRTLNDATLWRLALGIPFLTLKVVLGIHWEAFKLWRKGLPLYAHTRTRAYGASFADDI